MTRSMVRPGAVTEGAVVTKGVIRAASRLGVPNKALASIIGLSEASVSRMGSGTYALSPRDKSYELAVLFIRLFRSLDAIAHGDEAAAQSWLRSENLTLGGKPLTLIQSVPGLVHAVAYLDAHRTLV
jgi:hypothetical protein